MKFTRMAVSLASSLKKWPSIKSVSLPGEHYSRRSFLVRFLGFVISAASLSIPSPRAALSDTDAAPPDATDLEIAALGAWFRAAEPDTADRLEALARKAVGLTSSNSVTWETARRARLRLNDRQLVSTELAREDIVFVDGWLLAHSEAGAALLFAAARAQDEPLPQTLVDG